MKITGQTDAGRVRKDNQDAFITGQSAPQVAFAVVCDGMGGAAGGNIASETAARRMADRLAAADLGSMTEESLRYVLESAVAAANADVYDKAAEDPMLTGMGTTLVVAVVIGSMLCVAHVGDSRAYRLSGEGLTRITRDHSVVQQMVERGELTEEEARSHPQKNVITRALGVEETVAFDYVRLPFEPGDKVLLCTDGLSNMVDDTLLETTLRQPDAVPKLVQLALDAGGSDNVTACVIENE